MSLNAHITGVGALTVYASLMCGTSLARDLYASGAKTRATVTTNRELAADGAATLTQVGVGYPSAVGVTPGDASGLVFAGSNTYSGATTVNNGLLRLGADGAIRSASPVILAGGTLDMGRFTNTAGTLAVTGAGTLVLGPGALSFANSSGVAWPGELTLAGDLGAASVRFGADSSGLTSAQLAKIHYSGQLYLDTNGYLRTTIVDGILPPVR